jgi:Family of unknown function (DUF6880)
MNLDRKQRLVELGADRLAATLLELASRDDAVDDLVERLIATPEGNIKRFKARLSGIKRTRRFIRWGESAAFARELLAVLVDLQAGVTDPRTGAELVAAFYECDKGTLGNCDDSSGHVGDVFRQDARELFVGYALRCDEKEWLGELVFKVNRSDDYGVRDRLIDCAADYLPEPVLRTLVARFQKQADKESDEYAKRHWLMLVESIARQLKDAPLFERTRLASWGSLSTAACVDISRVYLESGDGHTALTWLENVPETESFMAAERDELLFEVFERLNDRGGQSDTGWRMFRRSRSLPSLERLLEILGFDQKDTVVEGEITTILAGRNLSLTDAAFLAAIERYNEVEIYLFSHADQLNGDYYGSVLPLAEAMEKKGRHLCAYLLYRTLLDSILRRAQTKIYPHGVRYLKKLDQLAGYIADWRTIKPHAAYLAGLQQHHGRKSSFWSRYGN